MIKKAIKTLDKNWLSQYLVNVVKYERLL